MADISLDWDDELGAFAGRIRTKIAGTIDLIISPNNTSSSPDPAQVRSAEVVADMATLKLGIINDMLRQYAANMVPSADAEDRDDQWRDFEATDIHLVIVPPLRDAQRSFAFLVAGTPIDEEHGIALCMKDGMIIAVVHSDFAYATCR